MRSSIILFLFILCSCESETYHQGRVLYENFCQNCHMSDGSGLKSVIPPLKNSEYLQKNQDKLVCIIRHGMKDTLVTNNKTFVQTMPGALRLTQGDITNIINYINNNWGNNYGIIKYENVLKQFETCR
jgi:mono/diheme cytochrome c family protein